MLFQKLRSAGKNGKSVVLLFPELLLPAALSAGIRMSSPTKRRTSQ